MEVQEESRKGDQPEAHNFSSTEVLDGETKRWEQALGVKGSVVRHTNAKQPVPRESSYEGNGKEIGAGEQGGFEQF